MSVIYISNEDLLYKSFCRIISKPFSLHTHQRSPYPCMHQCSPYPCTYQTNAVLTHACTNTVITHARTNAVLIPIHVPTQSLPMQVPVHILLSPVMLCVSCSVPVSLDNFKLLSTSCTAIKLRILYSKFIYKTEPAIDACHSVFLLVWICH